jgi:hypothetical protein
MPNHRRSKQFVEKFKVTAQVPLVCLADLTSITL